MKQYIKIKRYSNKLLSKDSIDISKNRIKDNALVIVECVNSGHRDFYFCKNGNLVCVDFMKDASEINEFWNFVKESFVESKSIDGKEISNGLITTYDEAFDLIIEI
jgi:hypothetical protein